jgi:hypothetical protein
VRRVRRCPSIWAAACLRCQALAWRSHSLAPVSRADRRVVLRASLRSRAANAWRSRRRCRPRAGRRRAHRCLRRPGSPRCRQAAVASAWPSLLLLHRCPSSRQPPALDRSACRCHRHRADASASRLRQGAAQATQPALRKRRPCPRVFPHRTRPACPSCAPRGHRCRACPSREGRHCLSRCLAAATSRSTKPRTVLQRRMKPAQTRCAEGRAVPSLHPQRMGSGARSSPWGAAPKPPMRRTRSLALAR